MHPDEQQTVTTLKYIPPLNLNITGSSRPVTSHNFGGQGNVGEQKSTNSGGYLPEQFYFGAGYTCPKSTCWPQAQKLKHSHFISSKVKMSDLPFYANFLLLVR